MNDPKLASPASRAYSYRFLTKIPLNSESSLSQSLLPTGSLLWAEWEQRSDHREG